MSKGKSLIWGFAAGTLIAGATTLLTTPKRGQELRKSCRESAENVKDLATTLYNDSTLIKEQVERTVKDGSELIKNVSHDLKTSVNQWKQDIEPHKSKIEADLDDIKQSIEKLEDLTKSN